MMKLYYKPLSCPLAVHIALLELGLPFERIRVTQDGDKRVANGEDYRAIHPLGAVPALVLDDGTVLTESAVILEYLAQKADSPLAPMPGDADYWEFRQIVNFIATDIHKNYGPLFYKDIPPPMRQAWLERLDSRIQRLGMLVQDRPSLMARGYTVADFYLFVMLFWASYVGADIEDWPVLARYYHTLSERPAVKQAVAAEVSEAK